jgi:hypothetical protein
VSIRPLLAAGACACCCCWRLLFYFRLLLLLILPTWWLPTGQLVGGWLAAAVSSSACHCWLCHILCGVLTALYARDCCPPRRPHTTQSAHGLPRGSPRGGEGPFWNLGVEATGGLSRPRILQVVYIRRSQVHRQVPGLERNRRLGQINGGR